MDESDKSLNSLHESIEELEKRLVSLLDMPPPQPKENCAPMPSAQNVVEHVRQQRSHSDFLNNRVRSILERLHV